MSIPGTEPCETFVAVNRLIAERFTAKASKLLELTQVLDDDEERNRIEELVVVSRERAAMHAALAKLQEKDMGVKCHCRTPAKPQV